MPTSREVDELVGVEERDAQLCDRGLSGIFRVGGCLLACLQEDHRLVALVGGNLSAVSNEPGASDHCLRAAVGLAQESLSKRCCVFADATVVEQSKSLVRNNRTVALAATG